jgi:hypothetical protein
VDEGGVTFELIDPPDHGTLVLNPDGSFEYTPDEGYVGPDEFTVEITDESGWTITETIYVNVKPLVSIEATDPYAWEDGDIGQYEVTRTGSTAYDLVVRYAVGGTALSGDDYEPLEGAVTILAGEKSATFDVNPFADILEEGDELVVVELVPPEPADTPYLVATPPESTGVVIIHNMLGNIPAIDVLDRDEKAVTGLKIGTWEDAFEVRQGVLRVKQNWIDIDPHRFKIQVAHKAANTDPTERDGITVSWATQNNKDASFNEPLTPIYLVETGPNKGVFQSDWLMLTSNAIDDEYDGQSWDSNPGKIVPNDRTHRIMAGGKVFVEYTKIGVTKVVDVPFKKVKVAINIFADDNGQLFKSKAEMAQYVDIANKVLAPAGIWLDSNIETPAKPNDVKFSDGLMPWTLSQLTPPRIAIPGEMATLLDPNQKYRSAPPQPGGESDDIEVFVTNFFTQQTYRGMSIWRDGVSGENIKYADCVFVSSKRCTIYTLAHEIGHVLLNDGDHIGSPYKTHLMLREGTTDSNTFELTSSRRIYGAQANKMNSNRTNLLKPLQ